MTETINGITFDENDSLSSVIDSALTAPGVRKVYAANSDIDWIMTIGNKDMQDGIRELPPIEQEIVKLYFLDGKSLIDIATDLNMSPELLCGHIKAMRVRLMCYV